MKIDLIFSVIFARTGLLYCGFLCVPATLGSRWVFQGGRRGEVLSVRCTRDLVRQHLVKNGRDAAFIFPA